MLTGADTKTPGGLSGIQPDPHCWALDSTALENKQSNQQKTPNTPPESSQANQVHLAPLHLINPNPLNLTENLQA